LLPFCSIGEILHKNYNNKIISGLNENNFWSNSSNFHNSQKSGEIYRNKTLIFDRHQLWVFKLQLNPTKVEVLATLKNVILEAMVFSVLSSVLWLSKNLVNLMKASSSYRPTDCDFNALGSCRIEV
jgi:hypothetical protein